MISELTVIIMGAGVTVKVILIVKVLSILILILKLIIVQIIEEIIPFNQLGVSYFKVL